jgi:cytochrome c oxidase assembly protein subunit 15
MKGLGEEDNNAMNARRLIKIFAILTSIGAYFMILLGVFVTSSGSGQGCGNTWPFCHGQIIPGTLTITGMIEYSHRISSSLDGFLVLVLTLWAWFLYRKDFQVRLYAFLSLLFVIVQGALGALTVVAEGTLALPWILSVHFGLALIAFASVILLTIRLFQMDKKISEKAKVPAFDLRKLHFPVWGLAVYTYLVVYTGALVEHTGAVTACGYEIPGCGSTYFPNFTSLAGIQMFHRYAAGLLWLLVLGLLVLIMRRYRTQPGLVRAAWWAFSLITLQAISGMLNVLTQGQMLAGLLHATLITVFFSVLCSLCAQVGWPWAKMPVAEKQTIEEQQVEATPFA